MRKHQPMLPTLIGSADAAKFLGIDKSTLTRWVQAGVVPVVGRLPGKHGALIFSRADIEAFQQRETDPAA